MRNACLALLLAGAPALAETVPGQAASEQEQETPGPEAAVEDPELERTPDGTVLFRSVLNGKPLPMDYRPDQEITEAVEEFHRTGENPYSGAETAVAEGGKLYARLCAACHLPKGTGRIGPSLVDDEWRHPRIATDVGAFEVIYGGGAGAMQAFGKRMDQEEILKVMAFVESLRE